MIVPSSRLVSKRSAYRERSHRKGVNIALFRRDSHHWVDVTQNTFRGHVSKSFWLVGGCEPFKRPRDCEVSETRLTILSYQDVFLDEQKISVRVCSILQSAYRTNTAV